MTFTAAQAEDLKRRYRTEAIETATPAVRLTMIFDRLVLDLRRADQGFDARDLKVVSDNLIHAQEILITLRSTLRLDGWEGAPRLAALYDHLHRELVTANLDKDRARAASVAAQVEQLCEAWHRAADRESQPLAEAGHGLV